MLCVGLQRCNKGLGCELLTAAEKHPVVGFALHSAPQFGGEALLHFLSLSE